MEGPIKKSGSLLPKMFRVFTLYIFVTLAVFFGYVELFGDVKAPVITLPVDDVNAGDDSYFGSFVESLMSFKNVYVEGLDLSFENDDKTIKLSIQGNVAYDLVTNNLSLDLDMIYNDQIFDVGAVFVSPDLFLTIENSTYKFDTTSDASGEIDFSGVIEFITKNLNLDLSFVDEIGEYLGIDFSNMNIADLQSQLKIDAKKVEEEGYEFIIGFGNAISAQVICDENFNITQAKVKDILIKGNAIKFNAPKVEMNSDDNVDRIVVPSEENVIDMSGLTQFGNYAQNLFENDYVVVDLISTIDDKTYSGKLFIDNSDQTSFKAESCIEGIEVTVAYKNEIVYVDAENLKLSFNISDYTTWKEKLDSIFVNQTSKTVSEYIKSILDQVSQGEIDKVDFKHEILKLLGSAFENGEKINEYLPDSVEYGENTFAMLWNNGLRIELFEQDSSLNKAVVTKDSVNLVANFAVASEGFEVSGEYYDVSAILPIADLVDEILTSKQFGGKVEVAYKEKSISADYVVDFSEKLLAQIKLSAFGEELAIYVNDNQILTVVGEIVIEGQLNDLENYISRINQIFDMNISTNKGNFVINKVEIEKVVSLLKEVLKNINLYEQKGYIAVIEYLTHTVTVSLKENVGFISYIYDDIETVIEVSATAENLTLPTITDNVDELLNKVDNVKKYIETKEYAFEFVVNYENLQLAGKAQIDLNNNIVEISGIEIGQNKLSFRYQQGSLFVNYSGRKFMVEVENVKALAQILASIATSNEAFDTEVKTEEILTKIFGEDVLNLSVEELLKKLSVDVSGNFDAMKIILGFDAVNSISINANVTFENDMLKAVEIESLGVYGNVLISDFDLKAIDINDYYNLTSSHKGMLTISYKDAENDLKLDCDIELDLSDKLYVKVSTEIFGSNIEILILNNMFYVTIDGAVVSGDFNNAKELFDQIVSIFEITLPESSIDFEKLIKNIDLNAFDVFGNDELEFTTTGDSVSLKVDITENVQLSLKLNDDQTLNEIVVPEANMSVESLLLKAESIMAYVNTGIYELNFNIDYNGLDLVGKFKYYKNVIEISDVLIAGEYLNIRIQDGIAYLKFGNMKIKFNLPTSVGSGDSVNFKEILNKITSDNLGVVINFGVFKELLNILCNYSINDYVNNILIGLTADSNVFNLTFANKNDMTISEIVSANVTFEENKLNRIMLNLYDVVHAELKVCYTETSTIPAFDADNYSDYSEDYVDGMLNSLKVREDVYAFSSDIAIRYSNNKFYGNLSAMVVENPEYNGEIGHYMPAVYLSTTSLGLNTYIYIIGETAYIDINGLQISADLNVITIEEILAFVEEKFGITFGESSETLNKTSEAFKVILPAIDQIYGAWVKVVSDSVTQNGVQFEIKDSLWYSAQARFYDIVAQLFIQNYENTIVPTKFVLGANIDDPNTEVYEDYSEFLLDCEEPVTSRLNFAVYLNNLSVGKFVENLDSVFVSEDAFKNITAVKSNYGVTNLADFNPYTVLLETVETVYDYAVGMNYQIRLDASMVNGDLTTSIGGDVRFAVGELGDGEENQSGFQLFGNKYLQVYMDGLDIQQKGTKTENGQTTNVDVRHLIDLRYRSTSDDPAFYITYTHSNYADSTDLNNNIESGNKFRAKISNSNLSDIISMALAFANVNLGDDLVSGLGLPKNTTDFTYLQEMLNIGKTEVDDSTTKVDQLLSSIENITKMVKEIKLSDEALTVKLDLNGDDNITLITISFVRNNEKKELEKIEVNNLVMGENVINLSITINDFTSGKFSYFDKNPLVDENGKATHIDFSEVSSFVDTVVNTINTKSFNFQGKTKVGIPLFSDIDVGFDLFVSLDENNEIYMYMELDVGKSREVTWTAVKGNDKFTTYNVVARKEPWSKRITTIEYKAGVLNIVNTSYDSRSTDFSSPKNVVKNYSYTKDQIGTNIMQIMAQALGLTNTVYDVIEFAITKIDAHPTIERAILDFGFNSDNSNYSLLINAENLMGMSGVANMSIDIGMSEGYNVNVNNSKLGYYFKTARFIESVSTELKIGDNLINIPITLNSVNNQNQYTTYAGKTLYTNDYWRKEYLKSIGELAA